jgi:hypothetical protein
MQTPAERNNNSIFTNEIERIEFAALVASLHPMLAGTHRGMSSQGGSSDNASNQSGAHVWFGKAESGNWFVRWVCGTTGDVGNENSMEGDPE